MTDIKSKILEKLRFSDHDAYYRLGYDSEKEPGVKHIIEGAKGENNHILSLLDPILENYEECVRALSDGDQYTKSKALSKHKEIMGGGE